MHDVGLALEILLDGPHPTLWDSHCMREALRFLRKRGKDIPRREFSRLIKVILAGPPRERYREDLTDEEWAKLRDRQIRLRLHKLQESGAKLPKPAKRVYDRIQREFPWQPRGDRSEEFPFFLASGWVDRDDPGTMEDFAAMSVKEFIQWAETQTGRPWECGGGWHVFVEKEPKSARQLLRGAAEHGAWPVPPWYMVLSSNEQAAKAPKKPNREIAHTLVNMPLNVLAELDLQAARWLENVRKALPKGLRQNLWRRIWDASLTGEAPEGDLDFDLTLNHAGGVLGIVLYNEMAEYIPQVPVGEHRGLPRKLRIDFEKIAEGGSPSAKLARVQMASMLYVLHRIDPEWTARALLSRMDLDDSNTFDPHLWEGYLWHARWSNDLLVAIKGLLFKVLGKLDRIPERIRNHGPQLFIQMAIPPDRGIDMDEARGVLHNMGAEYLADVAWALRDMLQAASDKSPALWLEAIGPWFDKAWPKRPQDRSPRLSEQLAWMAIDSGDAFPDVVGTIVAYMTQEEWASALFHLKKKEEETHLVSRFPEAALTLADKLAGDRRHLNDDIMKTLLDAISRAEPKLQERAAFKRLFLKTQ